jgi:hypothetical protein
MAKQGGGQYFAKSKSVSQQGRGEYYQPTAVIDKQSGKIWRDAVASVGKSVADVIDKKALEMSEKRKRAQELMDTTMKYAMERQDSVFENLQKQGVNNPSIVSNFQELLKQEKNTFRESLSARTPADQDAALEKMAQTKKQMAQLSTLIDQSNESQTMYDKDIQSGNLLGQGTLNLSGEKNTEWAKMMNIRAGINEGTETWGTDENGEWTVTYDGPELGGPVTQKAALFFGYDPGTIPEVDKFFKQTFMDVGAIDKNGKPTDKFLDTKSVIQSTNDPAYSQVAYNVKMDGVATATSQQTIAYTKSIAQKIPEAEATWDNVIPNSIKEQVAAEFGVKDYADLKSGSAYGQLDEISGKMFERSMLLYGGTQIQNQRLGGVLKNNISKGGKSKGIGGAGGNGNVDGFVEDFNNKSSLFGIGINDAGVYTGQVDLQDPNFPKALTAIGFEVVETYDGENGVVGIKIKPKGQSGTSGTFEVTEKMNAQDFVRDLVNGITKNKNREQATNIGYGFKEPNEIATGLLAKYTN